MKEPQKDNKERVNSVDLRIILGFGMALLCIVLVWGLKDQLRIAIDKCLVPLFGFKGNNALSCFFALITIVFGGYLFNCYCIKRKIVSARDATFLVLILGVYAIFRFFDGYYQFEGYWGSGFAYTDGLAIEILLLFFCFIYQMFSYSAKSSSDEFAECFSTDLPIESYDEDFYQLKGLVERITRYIIQTDVSKHSFSIGIVGRWGEGKSSLLNLIKRELEGHNKDYLLMDFNPRASKDLNHIQEDFLLSLQKILSHYHSGMRGTIAQYASTINVADETPALVKWLMGLARMGSSKDIKISRKEVQDAILRTRKKIIVFVDDMDRLTGKEILEVLKVVEQNGAFARILFLVAYDKKYVNKAISEELGAQELDNYIDKHFSVEIRLPSHPLYGLIDLLQALLKKAIDKGVITKVEESEIDEVLKENESIVVSHLKTIRDIKRFVNQFVYSYASVQEDVHFRDYFLLELIKYSLPDEYYALIRFDYLKKGDMTNASNDLYYLRDELSSRSGKGVIAGDRPKSIDILESLFPYTSIYTDWYQDRANRIYSASSFAFYFYNYDYTNLTKKQLHELFSLDLSEACSRIASFMTEQKRDLNTFLLTWDIKRLRDSDALRRYFQLILFAYETIGNINYWGVLFSFLQTKEVKEILNDFSIKGKEEYKTWMLDSLLPFLMIRPSVASSVLQQEITILIDNPSRESSLFVKCADLQSLSSNVAIEYLKYIDLPQWDPFSAYFLAQIPQDKDNLVKNASLALRESMRTRFERYSNKLVTITKDINDDWMVTITDLFKLRKVFPEPHLFGAMINSREYDSAREIELIRAVWPLYASNGFRPVIIDKNVDIENVKKTLFEEYLKYLDFFKKVGREVTEIRRRWEIADGTFSVKTNVQRLSQLDSDLSVIKFDIVIKERCRSWIKQLLKEIGEAGPVASTSAGSATR